MKQFFLMASLAILQTSVASAAQPRFADESFVVTDVPGWYCLLAVAGSEQGQSEEEKKKETSTEEEPDCD